MKYAVLSGTTFRFGLIFTRFVLIIQLFFFAVKIIAASPILLPKFKKYVTIKGQNAGIGISSRNAVIFMILFFDTETTGLVPGRIIQLTYIMQSEKETIAKNFFFAVSYIEPSAVAVHGFTPEKLAILSNGHTFSTDTEEIYDDFLSADLIVAHNVKFDINFMIAEFCYQDRRFRYKQEFDTMKFFTEIMKLPRENHKGYKYPKLSELTEFLDIYPYDVTRKSGELFSINSVGGHDARYDTAALYLAFNEGAGRYAELNEIKQKYISGEQCD